MRKDLEKFIRLNSVTSKTDAGLAYAVGKRLKAGGFRVSYRKEKRGGTLFVNVTGVKGTGRSPLLLCAHLDTVPPGDGKKWTRTKGDPWNPTVKGNRVYGLGAADDKASLAAMLCAGALFRGEELKRPLVILGTFGEESGMGGARLFTRLWKGPKPRMVIVGEPTNLEITYRHKGIGVAVIEMESSAGVSGPSYGKAMEKTFRGREGHSSRPWLGENALEKAMDFLRSVSAKEKNAQVVRLEGGEAANVIPGRASLVLAKGGPALFPASLLLACHGAVQTVLKKFTAYKDASFHPSTVTSNFGMARRSGNTLSLTFDFRLLPGLSMKRIFSDLEKELAKRFSPHVKGFRLKVWLERDNPPLDGRRDDPCVRFGRRLLRMSGLEERLSVKPACTEAGIYAEWGVPAMIFGPGESAGNIHAPNESVSLREMERAVRFYACAIREVCVKETV